TRIFINLERRSPPATFRLFGPRVVPTFNYFQTAAVLATDGYLGMEQVAQVGRVLLEGAGYTPSRLENSLGDLVRRGFLTAAAADELGAGRRGAGVLPPGGRSARWRRIRSALRRLGRRRREARGTPASAAGAVLDYDAILDRLRPEAAAAGGPG